MKTKFSTEIGCVVLMGIILVFHACKAPSTIEGPELNELYGTLGIKTPLALSTKAPDFAQGIPVNFSLELTKINKWTISITGLNSGAVKVITGKSKVLDVTNAVWNGSTTLFPLFKKEKAAIQVSFEGQTVIFYDTVNIFSQKSIDPGVVVAKFNAYEIGVLFNHVPKLIDYSADGDNINIASGAPYFPNLGTSCMFMKGTDKDSTTYIGNVTYNYSVFNPTSVSKTYPISYSDPTKVYFNVAVYGNGTEGSRVNIQFSEDCNDDGVYTASADNLHEYPVIADWNGWRMVSFTYDKTNRINEGNPNKSRNPKKILSIGFIHFGIRKMYSELALDYAIFTEGKAFEP